ncbi:uncharacterized protein LOC141786261 [Halichoeres trimaculatus]|uniref:uncharacterized protein LOC141786261 n=1 Tax=Halichoeres trimaculatus TaxID=147232 RepID=UPI003D9E9F4C
MFTGRCSLDLSTGALTIRGLSGSDNGYYSAEINDKQIDSKTQLTVISKVSKPSIYQWCNSETTYCTLTCEGNTADAQPISYKWFADDVEGSSDNEIDIREDTKEESFYCMLLNPVSRERSESISNPIITFKYQRNLTIAAVSAGVIGLILCCVAGFFIYKRVQSLGPTGAGRRIEEDVKWYRRLEAERRRDESEAASEIPEESNQGSASGVTQNCVGGSDSESQRVSTQIQVNNEPQNDGHSSEEVPLMAETSKQDPESAESPDTREETGNTTGTGETPNQDLTVPESLNTSEETEKSAVTSNNHEVTNHKSTNHQSTNPKPALVEEEADGGGDGD